MEQFRENRIKGVQEGSIAADLGLVPGDSLLLLDGLPLRDIFDYRQRQLSEHVLLTVRKADGETIEFEIDKDEDEDLGLEFAETLLAPCASCRNRCVFCFIDQMPPGLRSTLYFKDDDYRLSFLTGNYVTLTNLDEAGLDRLIQDRLSPVNVSVHTTDPELRRTMLRHKMAGQVFAQLKRITAAGLAVNAQIVLCPGLNDGDRLHRTLSDLANLGDGVQSIAVVPVGLTRFRKGNRLTRLQPVSPEDAQAALREIAAWQRLMLDERQTRLVYAADELYLLAGWPLPPVSDYEDFPQLENGVGMASLMVQELAATLAVPLAGCAAGTADADLAAADFRRHTAQPQAASSTAAGPLAAGWPALGRPSAVLLATGMAAAPLLEPFLPGLAAWSGLPITLAAVRNCFFGETVTVAGLVTGQDLLGQLPAALEPQKPDIHLILPSCMFKADEDLTLDGCTLQQIADRLDTVVHICPADAAGLTGILAWLQTLPVSRAGEGGVSA